MNYQHAFHAGNFADVHKHLMMSRILVHLCGKPTAYRVIDTHAGAGRYDLRSEQAVRGSEWQAGIGRICLAMSGNVGSAKISEPANRLLQPYWRAVMGLNPHPTLRWYPGSPLIALHFMRAQDRLLACELEPRAARQLAAALRGDRRAKALEIDGWTAVGAYVPPKERRGLVLIDPPYEDAADFSRLATALAAAHRKWSSGIYLLWYPIKSRDAPDALARTLQKLAIAKILRCEFFLGSARANAGLVGSGVIVVNPPFTLEPELTLIMPTLSRMLGGPTDHRLEWLAAEPAGHFSTS